MKALWRAFTITKDGRKCYIKEYIAVNNHHHTTCKMEAQKFTTDQKHKIKNYEFERVLKNDRTSK